MPALLVNRRLASIAGALVALVLTALLAAPRASAAVIYACVNKRTGAARVFTHRPKCRKNETRFQWNTPGPAGKNGANGKNGSTGKTGATGKNGTNGTNGSNGTLAGYSASEPASIEFTGKKEATKATILTKSIPAGNYMVFAKTVISSTATAEIRGAAVCELLDGAPSALDVSGWDTGLADFSGEFVGEATLSMQAAVSLKAATVLSLACSDLSPDEDAQKLRAAFSQIEAVQTTQNS